MWEFTFFWRAIRVVARVLFLHVLGWDVRVEGREHLPDDGAVLAFNHHGYVDAVFVAVAPEQTISESYRLLPFKPGVARMAIEADVPIVPAIGWGSHRAFSKGRPLRPRRGLPIVIRYCEPVVPRPGETVPALIGRLQASMAAALDAVQRSYPDAPGPGEDWWVPAQLGGSAPDHGGVVAAHQARFHAQRSRGDEAAS